MIVCSLNEVEVYGRRAARGAGMTWGLAEEAGKSARWLAERGLPGVELLVNLLTQNDGRAYAAMAPVIAGNLWRASEGTLCPVCTGVALSDRLGFSSQGETIRLARLAYPLLVASFLDQPERLGDRRVELRWPNVRVSVSANGVALVCHQSSALLSECVDEVEILSCSENNTPPTHRSRTGGVETPLSVWRKLDALAKRTYVPATEESRARGAGAGRTDND